VLLLAFLALSSSFTVRDISGRPVAGAAVCASDGRLLAVAGPDGAASVESRAPVTVRAVGYAPWTGIPEEGGTVYLEILPVPSGLVRISASRPSLADRIPSTTVLGRDALDGLTDNGIESMPSEAPGVVVREYGGAAPVVSISVRGSDPSQTAWLVDGHSISAPTDGYPSGILDPSMFGALEVARGAAPGMPSGGMSATVNLIPEPPTSPELLAASVDDRGGRRLLVRAGLAGLARVSIVTSHRIGEASTSGDETGFLCALGPGRLSGGVLVSSSSGGVEPPDWAPPTDAARRRRAGDFWISLRAGRFRFWSGAHAGATEYRSSIPDTIETSLGEGRLDGGAGWSTSFTGLSAEAGLSCLREWCSGLPSGRRSRDRMLSILQVTRPGRPALLADFSADACSGGSPVFSARIGASIPLHDSLVVAGASICSSGRRPTFNELYWPADGFAEGDSTLGAEASLEAGLDLAVSTGPARTSLGVFAADVEDLILWAPQGDGVWRPANIGRVRKAGLELGAALTLGRLSGRGTLSLLEMVDAVESSSTEGCQLPYRPWATWGLAFSVQAWRLTADLGAFGSSERYINAANTHHLPGYEVFSCTLAFEAGSGVGLEAGCRNLFDESYEESNGFPGSGRVFRLGASYGGENR
jgi:hypothetical protein